MKSANLMLIFKLQGGQRFRYRYAGMSMAELLKAAWGFDISVCPACGVRCFKTGGENVCTPAMTDTWTIP